MNPFRIPLLGKLVLGGAGSALLGVSLLGASAPALAATPTPRPAHSAAADHKHNDKRQDRRQIMHAVFDAEAAVLGMKAEELRDALKHGKTIEELAKAKGLNKDQFADKLATAVKPALDKLVDTHKITADQEKKVVAAIRAGHIPFWNGIHHRKK